MEIIINKRTEKRLELPDGSWEKMQVNGLSRTHRLIEKTSLKPKLKSKEIIAFLEKSKKKDYPQDEQIEPILKDIKKKPIKNKSNGRKEFDDESAHKDFKQK